MATFIIDFASVAAPPNPAPVVPAAAEDAIRFAATIWGRKLKSIQTIRLRVRFYPDGVLGNLLGLTVPNGYRFPNTCWFTSAMADYFAETDLQPGEPDISIHFNMGGGTRWNTDRNRQPWPSEHDLVTVAMHELCHGLGSVSLFNVAGATGSYGAITDAVLPPLVRANLGFTFPNLGNFPSMLDTLVVNSEGVLLANNPTLYPNPSLPLGAQLTAAGLRFRLSGRSLPVEAGPDFRLFSSLAHFDPLLAPPGVLMVPNNIPGQLIVAPDQWTCAVMNKLGWRLNP